MALTVESFFERYIIDCFSCNLTFKERIFATALSAFTGLVTLGIIHLTCAIINRKRIKVLRRLEENCSQAARSAKRVSKYWKHNAPSKKSSISQGDVQKCIEKMIDESPEDLREQTVRIAVFVLVFKNLFDKAGRHIVSDEDAWIAQIVAVALHAKKDKDSIVKILEGLGIKDRAKIERLIAGIENQSLSTRDALVESIRFAMRMEEDSSKLSTILQDIGKSDTYRELLPFFPGNEESIKTFVIQMSKLKENTKEQKSYQEMMKEVTSVKYPLIHKILTIYGLKKDVNVQAKEQAEQEKREQIVAEASSILKNQLLDIISNDQIATILKGLPSSENKLIDLFRTELSKRQNALRIYQEESNKEKMNFDDICDAFEQLPEKVKSEMFNEHLKLLSENSLWIDEDKYPLTYLHALHVELKRMVIKCSDADALIRAVDNVLQHKPNVPYMQTTVALAYEKAYQIHVEKGEHAKALAILQQAETKLVFDKSHPLSSFDAFTDKVEFLSAGCGFIRNRTMRVSHRPTNDGDYLEVSVEFPSAIRKRLEKNLEVLRTRDGVSFTREAGKYMKKGSDGTYDESTNQTLGHDLKITFDDLPGVELFLGDDKEFYNQHRRLRVRIPKRTNVQDLHKAFTRLGLPMALMPSRSEDIEAEKLARILAFRFPKKVYAQTPRLSPQELYDSLKSEERRVVDDDMQNCVVSDVNNGQLEVTNPHVGKEAWNLGARALASSLAGGDVEQIGNIIVSILKTGLLSSQERYDRGLIGAGTSPVFNCKTGSFNQAFTRLLTDNFFEDQFSLDKLAISSSVMLLFDVQALERMPYSYEKDRAGLRNPDYRQLVYAPEKQAVEMNFRGNRMEERATLFGLVRTLKKKPSPTTETMFNGSLGSQYLRRIVVRSEQDKTTLIHKLEQNGIVQIGGLPLEDVVLVGTSFNKDMLWEEPK